MCSLRRYINECDVLDIKPHTIESYADYIILHDHPPPRRAAAARKKRRKDAIGATEMTGGKAPPPSAHFKQYSNNTCAMERVRRRGAGAIQKSSQTDQQIIGGEPGAVFEGGLNVTG